MPAMRGLTDSARKAERILTRVLGAAVGAALGYIASAFVGVTSPNGLAIGTAAGAAIGSTFAPNSLELILDVLDTIL